MKKRKRAGQPKAINAPERRKILATLRSGGSYRDAILRLGLGVRTLFDERQRNEAFDRQCKAARIEGKLKLIATVFREAKKDGRLALATLARMYPEEWAESKAIEHRGKIKHKHSGSVTIQSVLKAFDDRGEEFQETARQRLQGGDAGVHGDGSRTGEVAAGEAPAGD